MECLQGTPASDEIQAHVGQTSVTDIKNRTSNTSVPRRLDGNRFDTREMNLIVDKAHTTPYSRD